jgi:hypothetical protein
MNHTKQPKMDALRQESLEKWLLDEKTGEKLEPPYTYFYLDWKEGEHLPQTQARWCRKQPEDIRWRRIFSWGGREAVLCWNGVPSRSPASCVYSGSTYDSFLKSHLQKAVRRRRSRAAVTTADLLLELNPVQLLRRLTVIMLEDSFLHESFSTLVWLMCALSSKKNGSLFFLREEHKRWLLGVTYFLILPEIQESVPGKYWRDPFYLRKHFYTLHQLTDDQTSLIYALEIRRLYGGLKGDGLMMKAFAHIYLERFQKNKLPAIWIKYFYTKIRPIRLRATPFHQREWIYAAYDFHCSPSILTVLEEEFPDYDRDNFKAAIWYKSSSLNLRSVVRITDDKMVTITPDAIPREITNLWVLVRRRVRGKAWGYVQHMLEDLNMMYPDWIEYEAPPEAEESTSEEESSEEEETLPEAIDVDWDDIPSVSSKSIFE